MTDRELMQQALDYIVDTNKSSSFWLVPESNLNKLVKALRERLAQPEQELVCVCGAIWEGQELVSTPSQRQWQGLTEEETDELVRRFARYELLRAIEAKLREKNA